jgi:hypothetical protein
MFLFECSGLISLDFRPLRQVTHIGQFFMFGCSSLTHLHVSYSSCAEVDENGFLGRCVGIQSQVPMLLHALTGGGSSNAGSFLPVD